jgi:hypothetical protein
LIGDIFPRFIAHFGYLALGLFLIIHKSLGSMKNAVFWLLLTLSTCTATYSQCNGNNGNGNGGYGNNGNGNGNGGWGNNGNPWAGYWPQWVITWLENGGSVPMPLAVAVIREAREWGMQNFGLNQGQMIQKYFQGQLTVEYVPTAPPSLIFRVSYGGGIVIISLEDLG